MSTGLIDKIDKALSDYYKQRNTNYYNGVGKFKAFCDDNGFEDDDIAEELKETDPNDCTLTDFDDEFPFDSIMENNNEKIETIFTVLKHIAEHESYPPPPKKKKEKRSPCKALNVTLNVYMCNGITDSDIHRAVQKYSQMECLSQYLKKDNNLKWFFAVSEKYKYPFLTFIVDRYTRDKAKHFKTTGKALSIFAWAVNNTFMKKLSIKFPDTEKNLQAAMVNYSNRIMRRVSFTPTYKINDNLKEICEYISAVPAFINKLMDVLNGGAPFQVDLCIAVKKVTKQVYDEDIDEKKELYANEDHIGDVEHNLANFPVAYFFRDNKESPIARDLGQRWASFRTELSEFNNKHGGDDDDEDDDEKKIKYDEETYPRNRRFCIFVDRREKFIKEHDDKITFFQPPNNCNKIKNDRVPEIGFELLFKCLLPRRNKNNIKNNITANTDVCGQLMTFMFNVEEKNEIKCYIVWNEQTMRFEGENMMNVLPYLFEANEENIMFIQEPEPLQTIKQAFIDEMMDAKYDGFCKALDAFT